MLNKDIRLYQFLFKPVLFASLNYQNTTSHHQLPKPIPSLYYLAKISNQDLLL